MTYAIAQNAGVNPIPLLILFAGASLLPILLGGFLVWKGGRGVKDAVLPFSSSQDLEGFMARVAGGFMAVFGLLFVCSGIGTIAFCVWRLLELTGR